jgi:hypothetical protein
MVALHADSYRLTQTPNSYLDQKSCVGRRFFSGLKSRPWVPAALTNFRPSVAFEIDTNQL